MRINGSCVEIPSQDGGMYHVGFRVPQMLGSSKVTEVLPEGSKEAKLAAKTKVFYQESYVKGLLAVGVVGALGALASTANYLITNKLFVGVSMLSTSHPIALVVAAAAAVVLMLVAAGASCFHVSYTPDPDSITEPTSWQKMFHGIGDRYGLFHEDLLQKA